MKLVSVFGVGAALVIASTSFASAALDFSPNKYFVAGKHQVYVWCTGGAGEASVAVVAANADEAIKKAVAGKPNCWGAWQGLNT